MSRDSKITLDTKRFKTALAQSPARVKHGTTQGFKRVKLSWVADAVDESPILSGDLRKQITGTSDEIGVMLTNNIEHGGFNYAYYQHEVLGNDYLDRSLDPDEAKRVLERELEKALLDVWGQ